MDLAPSTLHFSDSEALNILTDTKFYDNLKELLYAAKQLPKKLIVLQYQNFDVNEDSFERLRTFVDSKNQPLST